jgi:outer membrane murein-binding lipoprotein Lpp
LLTILVKRLLSAIAIAAALVVAGCAGQAHVDQDDDGVAHVNVSVLPIANVAPLYLGIRGASSARSASRSSRAHVYRSIRSRGALSASAT